MVNFDHINPHIFIRRDINNKIANVLASAQIPGKDKEALAYI